MTLMERLRAYGQHYEVCNEAAAEIERLEERCEGYKGQVKWGSDEIERQRAEIARLNDGLGQLAAKATEVELAIVELKKANDELGLVLNPTLSFAEVRRELKRRAVG